MKQDEGSRRCLHSSPLSRLPIPLSSLSWLFSFGACGASAYFFREVPSDHFGGDELAPAPDWRKQMTQEPSVIPAAIRCYYIQCSR